MVGNLDLIINSKFHFWQKWLTWSNIMAVTIGILVSFAGNSIVFEIHSNFTKDLFFLENDFNPEVLKLKIGYLGLYGRPWLGFISW